MNRWGSVVNSQPEGRPNRAPIVFGSRPSEASSLQQFDSDFKLLTMLREKTLALSSRRVSTPTEGREGSEENIDWNQYWRLVLQHEMPPFFRTGRA